MKYIEVSRIQHHADRLNDLLADVTANQPQLYSKTKHKYKELAISLLHAVDEITSILETDSLASIDQYESEFDNKPAESIDELHQAIEQVTMSIDNYTNFISTPVDNVSVNINKATLKRYGQVLAEAANYSFKYTEANECAYILNKWFNARFSNFVKDDTFKYNIAYLPDWITNIIIVYGKYHQNNNTSSFIHMMESWCNKLSSQPNKWVVPYEIHQLNTSANPESYTMDSVLIGDELMDEVFYQLTESNSPDLIATFDCYPVASAVKLHNPSLLPEIRTRLAKQNQLADQYNLTTTERR